MAENSSLISHHDLFDLSGKVALVTGASVGMGRAACYGLAGSGATLILCADAAGMARAREIAGECGGESMAIEVNVTSEESVARLFADVDARHGKLDILFNGVTHNHNKPMLDVSVAEWDHCMAVNLRSAFLATKQAVPLMRKAGGGRIINMTTIGSLHPVLHGNEAYSASRAALNAFTRNCAMDFASENITSNAILPGAIITETIDQGVKRTGPGADRSRMLMGYGKVEDVVGAILLFSSEGGRYITGQLLAIDGGFLVS